MARVSKTINSAIASVQNKVRVNKDIDLDGLATRKYLHALLAVLDRERDRAILKESYK